MSILIILNSVIGFLTAAHLSTITNNNEKNLYGNLATSSSGSSKDSEDNEYFPQKPIVDNQQENKIIKIEKIDESPDD